MIKYYKGDLEITEGEFLVGMIKEYPDIDINYLHRIADLVGVDRLDVPGPTGWRVIRSIPSPLGEFGEDGVYLDTHKE